MSSEKYVKQALKVIAKLNDVDYEQLKRATKKVLKAAKESDERQLGLMEELLDMTNNVSCEEDLDEFDIEVLKVYCQIKDLDPSGSDKSIRSRVWMNFEEEYGGSDDDSEDDVSEDLSDEEEEEESEIEVEVKQKKGKKPEPVVIKKSKKEAKVVFDPVLNEQQ